MRRKLVLAAMVLVTFLLQTTVFPNLAIASVAPNLLLILTVAFGFLRGKKEGLFLGFFCGLIIDLFYGDYLGFHALLYMYLGFFNGFVHNVYYDEDIKVPVLLVAVSDLVYNAVIYFVQFLMRGRLDVFYYLEHIILPEIVYTVLITMICYRLLFLINKKLEAHELEGQRAFWLRR
ncbi:MAG TPA: rod shape-determining protein MreD [Candidatus Egerieimonas intestinavium]|uniref:Rod shape-determining protein MreD n=1 Tax=Candidatus Egerieimonas intestinavium TaxID=2840777 RepID=A0A9D1JH43_9FIRM|nr:rod shape-determining protein MreD [Candidatus Egerieimonas intestinavium]